MLHFENTCCFVKAFDKAYGSLVNENALTKACSRTMSKTAEMLAQYCDQLLKRSRRRSADEIDDSLTDVIVIFGYLEDKHMFEARYRCLLAGRYLRNRVVNEDAERQMVSKLKECSGNMYTSHLQQMCRDVETSRAEMIEFRQQQAAMERPRDDTTSLDNINIRTIGYSYWPVQSLPSLSTGVPYEMTRRCAQFTQFYMNRHTGRTLTWLHEWSNGELATSCFGKQYNFRVTAFQMSVLLQYNDADRFTVKDLLNNTQMNATVLKDVLTSLVKHRVLLCDDDLSDDTRTLPDSAVFSLNLDYQSTTLSNNFISAAPRLTNESLYLKKITKEFRPYVVKAQIVNIMKQAGRLDHETLIRNVVERLRGYFQPPVSMIKNCIDELINQNYMKRVDDDSVGYCYVPEPYMLNAP